MFERIRDWFRRHFTQQATRSELAAELHMRTPESRHERRRRKTRKGATHQHRAAGKGRRRRSYLPAIVGIAKRRLRIGCRFVYARAQKNAQRQARLAVIANNNKIENALQAARLRTRGLLPA